MRYQGILFDLDGTLVDSAHDLYMALNLTLTEVAFPVVSRAQVLTWVGNGIDVLVQRGLSGDHDVNAELPPRVVAEAQTRFAGHYRALVGQYSLLYANVETVLAAFSHVPKAVVTNKSREFTEQLLDNLNLSQHFDVVVCGDDGQKKPAAEPLLSACQQLNIEPHTAIMVGDSKSDILAAHAAEIPVIALKYGYNQGLDLAQFNPQYLCEGFLDIIPILNQP
ncbi:HAD-IA family hydrolase [Pseudoalteromonas ardens]|uniref:phosphoglycolate phosphatase n=1 Tax=Pseudoalteromonas rubra TaxID=43658 RepID=A0A0L0EKY7_9GAMM|nr:HAD-IA family hydrolase [Pseudoalteromonas sp. R96]KNC65114.1 haloacid dehalogenase [Pseudoalteromonas rubra]MDK1314124.1 HAD-IA family hydrolase [Pseudoalteromonas sp. R96]